MDPGQTPSENLQFLVFLMAVLDAVYSYAGLLRATIASAGNDHRLGANEAPPAIVSVFLGSTLSQILDSIEKGTNGPAGAQRIIDLGISNLPRVMQDNTDRNRTSPFAFTGNKFEFRALGSSASISMPATVLNAAVTASLKMMAAELKADMEKGTSLDDACFELLKKYIKKTKAIRFEGNGYSDAWLKEAGQRGLPNLKNTPQALEAYRDKKNIDLLTGTGVFSVAEIESRYHTKLERYCNTIGIEYDALKSLARTRVLPAAIRYQNRLLENVNGLKSAGITGDALETAKVILQDVAAETSGLYTALLHLDAVTSELEKQAEGAPQAAFIAETVIPAMEDVRVYCDRLEGQVPAELWPLPTYSEMLFIM